MLFSPIDMLSFVIDEVCKNKKSFVENPDTDFTRNRKLTLNDLLMMLIRIEGNCMNAEIFKAFPDIKQRMCASAVIQQRDKLKPEIFLQILRLFNQYIPIKHRWKNKYRILAIDGSKFQTPTNHKSKYFFGHYGRNRKTGEENEAISMLHFHGLYDVLNRFYLDVCLTPTKGKGNDERSAAIDMMHRNDLADTIITMDRGYDGYNMIENGNRFGGHYIIRCKLDETIPEIENLPDEEIDKWFTVRVTISAKKKYKELGYRKINGRKKDSGKTLSKNTKYKRWDFEEACTVSFRAVKFQLDNGKWEVLLTNLNRQDVSLKDLKELYFLRWRIETAYRDFKYTIGSKSFHSKKDKFLEQELYAHTVMYNLVTVMIEQITIEVKDGEKHTKKVDFKMTVVCIRDFLFNIGKQSYEELLINIGSYVHSVVLNRRDKRKIRPPTLIPFTYRIAA